MADVHELKTPSTVAPMPVSTPSTAVDVGANAVMISVTGFSGTGFALTAVSLK